MMRLIAVLATTAVLGMNAGVVLAADMKPIHTQKTKDVVVTLANESGQWEGGQE